MRLRWWIFWGFVAWAVIANPHLAAQITHGLGHVAGAAARGISQFFADL